MLGTIIQKGSEGWMSEYLKLAVWCNDNNAMIVEESEHYKVVEAPIETVIENKREAIISKYVKHLDGIKQGILATLAMNGDISKLQERYKEVQQEMTKKLKEVSQ